MSNETLLSICALLAWLCLAAHGWLTQVKTQHSKPARLIRRQSVPCIRPIRNPAKPAWVQHDILRLKALLPQGSGVRQIAALFNRIQQAKPNDSKNPPQSVSKSYVAHVLRRHSVQALRLREDIRRRQPGICTILNTWAVDLTGKKDTQGQLHHILGIIDHGSRKLIALLVSSKHSTSLLAHILRSTANFGPPKHIRTDNERCFTSPAFSQALKKLGIHHQTTELHCPWQNGRIERLFGTLKQQLNQIHIQSAEHLQSLLDEFKYGYNTIRLHQHLGYQTPHEVWQQQTNGNTSPTANKTKLGATSASGQTWWTGWGGMLSGLQFQPAPKRRRCGR